MENNKKNELQLNGLKKALSNPMDGKALSGALPDDALEGVAGGAVLDSSFYIAKCNRCGWQCSYELLHIKSVYRAAFVAAGSLRVLHKRHPRRERS